MDFCLPNGRLMPGFRFAPTDEELAVFYLKRKVLGMKLFNDVIREVDIYKFWPSDLPQLASNCLKRELKWFFFCPRGRKYGRGERTNRAIDGGYWKATGNDRVITYRNQPVAKIKTLIFHEGKPPGGKRTDWVMHEYRLDDKNLAEQGVAQGSYALCEIFHKRGWGPQNGVQYGAPFVEEEWEDDDEEVMVVEAAVNHHQLMETANNQSVSVSVLTNCNNLETAGSLENQADSSAGYHNPPSGNLAMFSQPSELLSAAYNKSDSVVEHPKIAIANQSGSHVFIGCNSGSGELAAAVFACPSTSEQVCSEIVSAGVDDHQAAPTHVDSASTLKDKEISKEEEEIFGMLNGFTEVDAPLHSPFFDHGAGGTWCLGFSEWDECGGMDLSDLDFPP